jgi:hypothetical protein
MNGIAQCAHDLGGSGAGVHLAGTAGMSDFRWGKNSAYLGWLLAL